jgi:hypothetical protein
MQGLAGVLKAVAATEKLLKLSSLKQFRQYVQDSKIREGVDSIQGEASKRSLLQTPSVALVPPGLKQVRSPRKKTKQIGGHASQR